MKLNIFAQIYRNYLQVTSTSSVLKLIGFFIKLMFKMSLNLIELLSNLPLGTVCFIPFCRPCMFKQ